jgi:hypothetical protein
MGYSRQKTTKNGQILPLFCPIFNKSKPKTRARKWRKVTKKWPFLGPQEEEINEKPPSGARTEGPQDPYSPYKRPTGARTEGPQDPKTTLPTAHKRVKMTKNYPKTTPWQ